MKSIVPNAATLVARVHRFVADSALVLGSYAALTVGAFQAPGWIGDVAGWVVGGVCLSLLHHQVEPVADEYGQRPSVPARARPLRTVSSAQAG